ncbi:hypothetical protein B0O99DRAFT_590091 [Bisporella sp. PMI_857]|nr:hypothetical protein B0O99DRAFT_590793 [Bisporella sp. PMI_857]KAH8600419.1 hypothetical protein B0O99DRAFT_590091 [Bisporella sp. PMI_857]
MSSSWSLNEIALEEFIYTRVSHEMISYLAKKSQEVIQCEPISPNSSRLPPHHHIHHLMMINFLLSKSLSGPCHASLPSPKGYENFGFSRTEVNLMEKQLLFLLDWDLAITEDDLYHNSTRSSSLFDKRSLPRSSVLVSRRLVVKLSAANMVTHHPPPLTCHRFHAVALATQHPSPPPPHISLLYPALAHPRPQSAAMATTYKPLFPLMRLTDNIARAHKRDVVHVEIPECYKKSGMLPYEIEKVTIEGKTLPIAVPTTKKAKGNIFSRLFVNGQKQAAY